VEKAIETSKEKKRKTNRMEKREEECLRLDNGPALVKGKPWSHPNRGQGKGSES